MIALIRLDGDMVTAARVTLVRSLRRIRATFTFLNECTGCGRGAVAEGLGPRSVIVFTVSVFRPRKVSNSRYQEVVTEQRRAEKKKGGGGGCVCCCLLGSSCARGDE